MKLHASTQVLTLTPPARRGGFSIIELMVAMTIGLLLVAGLFYVYFGAAQSSQFQGAVAAMQSNARYASELMGLDIRMTGFTGSQSLSNVVSTPNPATLASLIDLANPLLGYDDVATNPPPNVNNGLANTDALTVVRVDTENKYAVSGHAGTSFTLSNWPTTSVPQQGEIFVAADYTHATVFQVGGTNGSAVSYGAGGTPGNSSTDGFTFGGSLNALYLYRLSGVTYYIATNTAGEPALYRRKLDHSGVSVDSSAEELVQGIEDMQILYGVDTSTDVATRNPLPGDGNIDGYWTATEVSNNTPNMQSAICTASASARWKCVLSVRIALTLVSGQNEKVGTTGDKLLRKTFTNTIAIRNRL